MPATLSVLEKPSTLINIARVLLTQSGGDVARFVAENMALEGFDVAVANSLVDFQDAITLRRFDVLVLDDDIVRPAEFERIAQKARASALRTTPVVWIASSDNIEALQSPTVVKKPLLLSELCGAVRRAAWARTQNAKDAIVVGEIVIEPWSFRVKCAGKVVDVTLTEFKLLSVLASSPGRVFSRAELLEEIWGPGANIELETINQHVVRLRRALKGACNAIRTVRAAGYALG